MNAQMNFIGLKVYLNVNFPICLRVMSKFFFLVTVGDRNYTSSKQC